MTPTAGISFEICVYGGCPGSNQDVDSVTSVFLPLKDINFLMMKMVTVARRTLQQCARTLYVLLKRRLHKYLIKNL